MDKTTFEQLYRDMLPGLYRLAQSMLRQTADAQDAVQQAAVSAWLSLERIRPGGERAYFTRIVINECRNIQRQRMRQTPVESIPERAEDAPSDDLKLAVAALSEELRLPLLMKYMEGYREREIAEALEISVPSVKNRLFRARRKLKELLTEEAELAWGASLARTFAGCMNPRLNRCTTAFTRRWPVCPKERGKER